MKRRFSIWVREYGSNRDVELMQVDSHPEEVCKGLHKKMLTIKRSIFEEGSKRQFRVPKYSFVQVVDNHAARGE